MTPLANKVIYSTYAAFGIAIGAIGFLRAFNRWAIYQSRPPRQNRVHLHP